MRRLLAAALALSLAAGAFAQAPPPAPPPGEASPAVEISTETMGVSTITVTAPREREQEEQQAQVLRATRAGGLGVAAGGAGIMAYAVIFEAAGPIGWAAGLLFFGGMTAYLSHRKLHGHDDFSPEESRRSAPPAGGERPERR